MKTPNKLFLTIMISAVLFIGCPKKPLVPDEKNPPPAEQKQELDSSKKETEGKTTAPENSPFAIPSEKVEIKDISPIESSPEKIMDKEDGLEITKPKKENAGSKTDLVFENILFDFDKFIIGKEMQEKLNRYAEWLKINPLVNIEIEGHCDERGTGEYNLSLGEKRANSIKKYLVFMGISPQRINTISYGEEKPLDPRHSEDAWNKNRRGHFNILNQKKND